MSLEVVVSAQVHTSVATGRVTELWEGSPPKGTATRLLAWGCCLTPALGLPLSPGFPSAVMNTEAIIVLMYFATELCTGKVGQLLQVPAEKSSHAGDYF